MAVFNKAAQNKLKLYPGCRVLFSQDASNPKKWFVRNNEGGADGFILKLKSGCISFNSAPLFKSILNSLLIKNKIVSLVAEIGESNKEGWHSLKIIIKL